MGIAGNTWRCDLCGQPNAKGEKFCNTCHIQRGKGDRFNLMEGWECCYVTGGGCIQLDAYHEVFFFQAHVYTAHGTFITHQSRPLVGESWNDEYYPPPRSTEEERQLSAALIQVMIDAGWTHLGPSNKLWLRTSTLNTHYEWYCWLCYTHNASDTKRCYHCGQPWKTLWAPAEKWNMAVIYQETLDQKSLLEEERCFVASVMSDGKNYAAYRSEPFSYPADPNGRLIPPPRPDQEKHPQYHELRRKLLAEGWIAVTTKDGYTLNKFWRP